MPRISIHTDIESLAIKLEKLNVRKEIRIIAQEETEIHKVFSC